MLHTITTELAAAAPFDFAKSLAFLRDFSPMTGEQSIQPDSLTKAILCRGQLIVFRVAAHGEAGLAVTLFSEQEILPDRQQLALQRIRAFLSLDDDLGPFYALGMADPAFAPLIDRLYGLHHVRFLTPFECGCWAILSQRLSLAQARQFKAALLEQYGTSLMVDGVSYAAFPEPGALSADPETLAGLLPHPRKVDALLALDWAFVQADTNWLASASYAELEAWLLAIKGIGPWSAAFILLRGMGHMERIPLGESRLQQIVARYYLGGRLPDDDEVRAIATRYGDQQGYWAFYLRSSE